MKTQLLVILFVLLASLAQAQHKVSGKIVDPQGEAIVGAIVQEENSTRGTVTDLHGNYELTTSSADAALLFSYIGYDTQRILVANKQTLNVTMYAASGSNKTLYLVNGQPTTKEAVDQLPPEMIKNMNVMRGVESVVLITTRAKEVLTPDKDAKLRVEHNVITIDKNNEEVTIDERLKGTVFRIKKDSVQNNIFSTLIVVKQADGSIRTAGNIDDFKPEQIKTVGVYKSGVQLDQFKEFGDTSNGVIYIELKK
ncbi:MAG: carboxypeptidase-like regulatory domain-containing protein [Alistipes sp.]|nr:carboxypeptidase-like regulatory domain-containing protein [Alistipes sp.]